MSEPARSQLVVSEDAHGYARSVMHGPGREPDPRLHQLVEEQAALRRVATLVAHGAGPDEMFSATSSEVGQLFGAECAIARFEPDGSSMVVVGLTNGIPVVTVGTRWELEDFLASTEVYRTGEPARNDHTGHATSSGPVAESLAQMSFVSTVAAPITVEGRLWGVMTVSDARKPLPPDTEDRVGKFTELVATAIANATSRVELSAAEQRTQHLAREQAALRRVATLVARGVSQEEIFSAVSHEVGVLFGADPCICRFETDGSSMVVVGVTETTPVVSIGLRLQLEDFLSSTTVYRTGRPARNDHRAVRNASGPVADILNNANYACTVSAPIVVQGNLWGVMTLSRADEPLPLDTESRLERFTDLVAVAIANAKSRGELAASEERAHALAKEQAALRRVATLVAEGVSAEELFAAVAEEVRDVVGIPVVGVQRFEDDRTFTMVGIAGETSFTVGSSWPVEDEGLAGLIRATGRSAKKEDSAMMPGPLGAALRDDRMTATVGVPIVVDGSMWGFMAGGARPGESIPDRTEQRLARFTELVATAIANSQAREHLARLATEQAALRRVATLVAQDVPASKLFGAVATEAGTLFGADFAALIRYECDLTIGTTIATWAAVGEHPPAPQRVPVAGGARGVAATGKPVRIDDYSSVSGPIAEFVRDELGVRSSVGSPIMVQDRLWGALAVHSKRGPLPPDAESRLLKFTQLVATAIANTNARTEVTELAEEQAALRRVATLVAEGAPAEEVLSAVAKEIEDVLDIPIVTICRHEPDGFVVLRTAHGLPGFAAGSRWPWNVPSLPRLIYETGRPARIDDFTNAPGLNAAARDAGVKAAVGVPIEVTGTTWGSICAVTTKSEPIPPDAERRLGRFRDLVATSISNTIMREQLAASRARVIAAGDDARRRIERDLHDGAQQRLVTLTVALRRAASNVPSGSDELHAEVNRIAEGLITAVEELRELSQGIHPAELTEGGLSPALKALGRRSTIRVELDVPFEDRLPDQVEVAAYYTVSEALTNASKHSDAKRVWVALDLVDDVLRLSIRDDGIGGANANLGSGLTGLRDRIEALGGRLQMDSPRGSGTSIEVEIPAGQARDQAGERAETSSRVAVRGLL